MASLRRSAVPLLLLGLVCGPTLGQDPSEPPDGREPLRVHMKRIGNQMKNAKARFNGGVTGLGDAGDGKSTPGFDCCRANLEKIGKNLAGLARSVKAINACYQHNGMTPETTDTVDLVKKDMDSFARAMKGFAHAEESGETWGFYLGATRAYNLMKESLESLPQCPPLDSIPPPESAVDELPSGV